MEDKPGKKFITDTKIILVSGVGLILYMVTRPAIAVEKYTCNGVLETELVEYLPKAIRDPRFVHFNTIGFVAESPDGKVTIDVKLSQRSLPELGDKMLFDICTKDGDEEQQKWYRRKLLIKAE